MSGVNEETNKQTKKTKDGHLHTRRRENLTSHKQRN
jgi:hypothetical protein